MTEILNQNFSKQSFRDESYASLPLIMNESAFSLGTIFIRPDEVATLSRSLQTGKAAGPDFINNRLLEKLARPLSYPLSDLFSFSVASREAPFMWKETNVTPIYKKD